MQNGGCWEVAFTEKCNQRDCFEMGLQLVGNSRGQLAGIVDAMEMDIIAPTKATETWWLEHKVRAMTWQSVQPFGRGQKLPSCWTTEVQGLCNKYRNTMYPLHVEYFIEILMPAAELSLLFVSESIDVVHGVKTFFCIIEKLKEFPSSLTLVMSEGFLEA